ncbi:hypothetical protein Nepgr_021923 [Nepenthes gracilis]|uniref:Methyltransferase-related protein n=1 Tax=Nepenthes gracilis TaxID=150966 RepID=A0AAD3XWC2_NEPGR|nr:hypothetical protein Nepgr_021923 [Nepenthes gracilis]
MCPLRIILVFLSAVLAGYYTWRSFRTSPEIDAGTTSEDVPPEKTTLKGNKGERDLKKMIEDGLWTFVDMASGRYLWRNLKQNQER